MSFFQLLIPSDAKQSTSRLLLTIGLPVILLLGFLGLQLIDFDQLGWQEGFSHPLVGWDHVVTMLAVGIWAAQLRGRAIWMLPLAFVSVMSLGGLAGSLGISIPSVEGLILLSCAVFSVLITRKVRFSTKINVMIVAFFGFFHGFAHGHEISTSASLVSYTMGFMLATLLLHGTGILVAKLVVLAVSCLFSLMLSNIAIAADSVEAKQNKHHNISFTDSGLSSVEKSQRNCCWSLNEHHCAQRSAKAGASQVVDRQHLTETAWQLPPPQALPANWPGLSRPDILIIGGLSFKHFFPDINQTPGLPLLSNGVGLTSPPLAIRSAATPPVVLYSRSVPISHIEAPSLQAYPAKSVFGDALKNHLHYSTTQHLSWAGLAAPIDFVTPHHTAHILASPHCAHTFFTTTTTT